MKVICISGHAQHGKDTVSQIMRKALLGYGQRVLVIHNADLLKFMCKQLFSWDGNKDVHGRTLLQYVGTDVVRNKKPNFWIDFIAEVLELFNGEWDYVLIPDCRFPNEVDVLKDRGFDVIHVSVMRDNYDNGLTEEQRSHPSETALDDVTPDVLLHNAGSIVDLTREVLKFIVPLYETGEVKIDGNWYPKSIA